MLQLNMITLTELTRFYGNEMKKQKRGKILNIASMAGFLPGPMLSTYYASKAYVLSLSEALHNELKPHGIHVSVLCPGPTATNFQSRASADNVFFFKPVFSMKSIDVARMGLKALEKNKQVRITGLMNNLTVFAIRFMPRSLVLLISRAATQN